jgi:hypothetical protein
LYWQAEEEDHLGASRRNGWESNKHSLKKNGRGSGQGVITQQQLTIHTYIREKERKWKKKKEKKSSGKQNKRRQKESHFWENIS